MKNTNVFKKACIIAFISIIGFSITGCDIDNLLGGGTLSLDRLIGVWEGSYFANQGETGLTLTVFMSGNNCRARFEFYNLPGISNSEEGSYYMNVSSDESKYILIGSEWIDRPATYVFVDLYGTINENVFSGSVDSPAGGGGRDFSVVRK